MRKVLTIAWSNLVRTARNRRALLMLLVMPLVLVAILGTALKGAMHDGTIDPFTVILVNSDLAVSQPAAQPGGPATQVHLGQILATDVFGSDEARKIIRLQTSTDLGQAKTAVTAGKAVAAVYVPPEFTASVLAGRPAEIQVFTDAGQPTLADIVTQVVRTFTDSVATAPLAAHVLSPAQLRTLLQANQGQVFSQKALPSLREVASGTRPVSAMQYYAAAMLAMFMVMTAFTRAHDILLEREQGTLARLLTSPTDTWTIVAGQMLGSMAVLLAQFAIMVLGTRLVYQVSWGDWRAVIVLGLAFALANTGISALSAGFLRDPKVADALVGVLGNVFAALSGGMFPIYIFPAGLQLLARFIPNYWALEGFLDQMAGVGLRAMALPVMVLTAIGLAGGALGAWRLAAKGV